MEIKAGMRARVEGVVTGDDTAAAMGSGSLEVLGTPRVAALMEEAACKAIAGALEPDQTSVGVHIALEHTSATPVGMAVWAEAEVTAVEGRTVSFRCEAGDSAGPIASAEHRRVLVQAERFTRRAYGKLG